MTRKKKINEDFTSSVLPRSEKPVQRYIKWSISWDKNSGRKWNKLELVNEYPEMDKTNLDFIYQPFLGTDQDYEEITKPDQVHEINISLGGIQ